MRWGRILYISYNHWMTSAPTHSEFTSGRVRGFKSGKYGAAFTGIRGKGTGAAQFPTESVSEQLAREQWQGDHGISASRAGSRAGGRLLPALL